MSTRWATRNCLGRKMTPPIVDRETKTMTFNLEEVEAFLLQRQNQISWMDRVGRHVAGRMREPTTWTGLVLLLTTAGVNITPEMSSTITNIGVAVAGAVLVATKDPGSDK